jgi:hypothetical protein
MDIKTKNKTRKFLTAVIAGDLSVLENETTGICFNLNTYIGPNPSICCGYKFVQDNCHNWEHFSGHNVYPVQRINNCKKWEHTQLELRQSLCKHLLEVLNKL